MDPIEIGLACPRCGDLARLVGVKRAGHERLVVWSDDYQEIGGHPPQQQIARCHRCKAIYWMEGAGLSDENFGGRSTNARVSWWHVPGAEPLDEHGYYEALDHGLAA